MAISNIERVGKALDLLRQGLAPFVEREFTNTYKDQAPTQIAHLLAEDRINAGRPLEKVDVAALLKIMWDHWNEVFRNTLGFSERSLVSEIRDARNKWAHQEAFSSDDADRALDSITRLLTAVTAVPQAEEVGKMKMELRRLIYDEQVRFEKRKAGGSLVETAASGTIKPWREVVTPHPDVASGGFQQAEFAADLWQVYLGEGSDEYKKPTEFFRRTYITESLKRLLVGAVQRLSGKGGDPVIQLQTNFGGGKTHSMLALFHLVSGVKPGELPGVDSVMEEAGLRELPKARRVVLVGNKISPGNPVTKADGTVVRTLWGELAYQLGGKKAYAKIEADDKHATNPGDVLRELFNEYGPCLILVDEWVAYARQLHDQGDLPAGGFETQFTFAQALTESAKLAKNTMLVISLPASDTTGSPHTQADDVEVGGIRGREALDRLRNVVGRLESSWRPASAEEGFEIVRRRLFEPLAGAEAFKQRDVTARAFAELYRTQASEFPPECNTADYEKRIIAAYPIHPEIFDRLYTDWSTLVKFQRTRGVLRLMATVIHSLWEKGDKNPLILPSTIPIDDQRVQFELTRYLSDNWTPIMEKDVDGPNSLPAHIDSENSNLGKVHATRRVSRTIYLGSAPLTGVGQKGLEDRRVRLGCVMPGEHAAVFGDALRRLASAATYLYQDGARYWYSTQPTVTKLAEDKAEQFARDPDAVIHELDRRLRLDLQQRGDFSRVHALPKSGADVPDELATRLVVLEPEAWYSKDPQNPAQAAAKAILETRGNTPRLYRNTLVFLAADKARFQDLSEAIRRYLAWDFIVAEKKTLNLTHVQETQAETQRKNADGVVASRIPETYQWLLVPKQANPQAPLEFSATRLSGTEALAARVGKKLKSEEAMLVSFGSTMLRRELDKIPLWRSDSVSVRQLVEDFARYPYLSRFAEPQVLVQAISDGLALSSWQIDTFAYADSQDAATGRYLGLRGGERQLLTSDSHGILVKPEVAKAQLQADFKKQEAVPLPGSPEGQKPGAPIPVDVLTPKKPEAVKPKRFHGTVRLDSTRVGRDAGRIAEEIVSQLEALDGAELTVTLEIEAQLPGGAPENVVRAVTENSRELKFTSYGFEKE